MAERNRVPNDVLSDSEAALRMMDAILEELQGGKDRDDAALDYAVGQVMQRFEAVTSGSPDLAALVMHVYLDVIETLRILRRTRSALERATVEQVQATQQKLREVSSTTELAATDMLDGLDRAIAMVDRLDALAAERQDDEESKNVRAELREELYRLIVVLQFQDIAAQQLSHASNVLRNVEQRLERVVGLLDEADLVSSPDRDSEGEAPNQAHERTRSYDPAASMLDAEDRQALADEIFTPIATRDR
ncbi:MAG TPA: hypothetical protein VIK91_21685 [Nannocystis sp.]